MYRVIHYFEDLQDFNHKYRVGDIFPRSGLNVSDKRLKELSGKDNRQKKPLIEKIEEKQKYKKTDINRMPIAELKEVAVKNNIEVEEGTTGTELKKAIIDKLNL